MFIGVQLLIAKAMAASDLPIAASAVAKSWDSLYYFLIWLSVFFFILVVGGMLYFSFKYKETPGGKIKYITDDHFIETIWTVIPTILLMVIFVWGWNVYKGMVQAPSDAYEIRVIGKQWSWSFAYDNGQILNGKFYVPVNKPVKLVMSSEDVIHSFFIPNMRVKQDVVPGMYTTVWFETTVPGRHQVFCTEYCGTSHSLMMADMYALTEDQWKDFNRGKELGELPEADPRYHRVVAGETTAASASSGGGGGSLAEQGRKIYQAKGCIACHSTDGSRLVGPSFKGLYGSKVELNDGKTVTADDNYLRESIDNPNATIVKGFAPQMPPFKGMIKEEEYAALFAYLKSLK